MNSDKQIVVPIVICIWVATCAIFVLATMGLEPFSLFGLPAWCRWIVTAWMTVAAFVHIWRGRFDA